MQEKTLFYDKIDVQTVFIQKYPTDYVYFYEKEMSADIALYSPFHFPDPQDIVSIPYFGRQIFSPHGKWGEKKAKSPHLLWLCHQDVKYVENSMEIFSLVENQVEKVENLLFFQRNYNL